MTQNLSPTHRGYGAGHCWYYLLGGAVLSPKQIKANTERSSFEGYAADDIGAADMLAEPKRSSELRALKAKVEAELRRDLSRYRQCALALNKYRATHDTPANPKSAEGVHVAISLKHNHLVNDFAHLGYLDDLLSRQGDLFGF